MILLLVLVVAEVEAPVEDNGRPLGRVAVLVRVRRHRCDPGEPEVKRRHRVSQALGPGEHETAQTGIGVKTYPAGAGQFG